MVNPEVNYIYDALKERLPRGWTLKRSIGPSCLESNETAPFYEWTRWYDGEKLLVEANEGFIQEADNVDALADAIMTSVLSYFGEPQSTMYTSPKYNRENLQGDAVKRLGLLDA